MQQDSPNPLVSIIALCFNHAEFVTETLISIINQTYENLELIIIDANSKDNSVAIVESWLAKQNEQHTFLKQPVLKSVCENTNDGLKQAKGKYFQLISCDDNMHPNKIASQVAKFEQLGDDYAFIFGNAEFINEHGKKITERKDFIDFFTQGKSSDMDKLYDALMENNFIPAMSVLVRRAAVDAVGGYDESIPYEDYPMWLSLLKKGYKGFFLNEINSEYRIHSNNLHTQMDGSWNAVNYWVYKQHSEHPTAKAKLNAIALKLFRQNEFSHPVVIDYFKHFNKSFYNKICYQLKIPYKYNSIFGRIKNKLLN